MSTPPKKPHLPLEVDDHLDSAFTDLWGVELLDDADSPFNHVVSALVTTLGCSLEEARASTRRAHDRGAVVVAVSPRPDAEELALGLSRARVRSRLSRARWSHQLEA